MTAPLSMRLVLRCCLAALLLLLSGCAATVPHWRSDAYASFNAALAAAADSPAPEETDTVRRTLELADRYYKSGMIEEADSLYRLAGLKSRLLSRALLAAQLRQGAGVAVDPDGSGQRGADVAVADEIVSLSDAVADEQRRDDPVGRTPAAMAGQPDRAVQGADSGRTSLPHPHDGSFPGVKPFAVPPLNVAPKAGIPSQARPRTGPGRSIIYLTFDDGPSRLTLPIATYLKSQGIRATFFVLGCNVKGHEKTVTSLVAMGHRVASHTFSHNLHKLKASFARNTSEIGRTASLIDRLGGDGRMVRIPYGASGRKLVSRVAAEGAQIFTWDIDSYDSTKRGAHNRRLIEKAVLGQLAKNERKHAIVLFHDGSGHDATLAALKDLIPILKERGYGFGLLSHNDKLASLSAPGGTAP
ncbi:polysaccharide deacetylase family protein [Oryzomonas sagensis]|uniref:Polysaccharide deacetylase family protein n=1 Tax=Oryzomonas sagensis TaxID=2603857 RepID=A0ABQ6TMT7_9BACT|nr:polysaccharide deacetylase family protein [Oryzomonas sagensis]KAB0669774.1 polysaccharide deacetylase family protein [Oryzomonas sagensis]